MLGYVVIVVLSTAVGVVVYHFGGRVPLPPEKAEAWAGAAPPAEPQAPRSPPTNFERLSISRVRRSWHDRVIGILGLVVSVAVATLALTGGLYLAGRMLLALLEKAAAPAT